MANQDPTPALYDSRSQPTETNAQPSPTGRVAVPTFNHTWRFSSCLLLLLLLLHFPSPPLPTTLDVSSDRRSSSSSRQQARGGMLLLIKSMRVQQGQTLNSVEAYHAPGRTMSPDNAQRCSRQSRLQEAAAPAGKALPLPVERRCHVQPRPA